MDKRTIKEKTSLKRKEGTYELPEITHDMQCPVCQRMEVSLHRTLYTLPDGDEIIILLLECNQCNYKKSDTIPLKNSFQPGTYQLTIDDFNLEHKIFRGASGVVHIPEIGISIERGPAATFNFTNIEGILQNMLEQVKFFIKNTNRETTEARNAQTALDKLKKVMKGELVFSVILEDEEGGSYITPTDPEKLHFVPAKSK